jgi:uncharacterized protein (TIGR02646 family)
MNKCVRSHAPALLARYGAEIAETYAEKRKENSAHKFSWPQREGQPLYNIVFSAAKEMTNGHCAYCDAFPITAAGKEEIDHFRPKSRPEFYHLVCDWDNLFFCCTACNGEKLEKWDADLLKPDEPDFSFENYFIYITDTGELEPSPAATEENQRRAAKTIAILGLNRDGACFLRKQAIKNLCSEPLELETVAYRFLIPLCRPAPASTEIEKNSTKTKKTLPPHHSRDPIIC